MKKSIFLPLLLTLMSIAMSDMAMAQARIARSEFLCYDRREDARSGSRDNLSKYIEVRPTLQFTAEGAVRAVYEQQFDVPTAWIDYNAYLHTENIGADYAIFINGVQITSPIDQFSPADIYISPYIVQGANTLAIVAVDEPYMVLLDENLTQPERQQFTNCYIFAQRRVGIYDYNVRLLPDSLNRFAQLHLDVVVDNSFTTADAIEVGYDIYDPNGQLKEYSVNGMNLEASSRDTMQFRPYIYHSNANRWSASNPKLYDLTLYVKRSGILWEYIPLKVGFAEYGYNDNGEITLFGSALSLNKTTYNAAADRATTEREIRALKSRGFNTLCPQYPQPLWFYDICDRVGMYVIDCAAISSPTAADNRTISGTPANAPELLDEDRKSVV